MDIPEELTCRSSSDASASAIRSPKPDIIKGLQDSEGELEARNTCVKTVQNFTGVFASDNSRLHAGNVYNTHYRVNSAPPNAVGQHSDDTKLMQRVLECLAFRHMNTRSASIATAHPKTCLWLVNCPEYKRWRDSALRSQHHRCLWIKGKPGSGKSTIMKSLLSNTDDSHGIAVSYFFNPRGVALERSVEGMLRCILFQMLPKLSLIPDKVRTADVRDYNEYGWPCELLKDLCRDVVRRLARDNPVEFYIDALDEGDIEDDIRDMVSSIEDVTERARTEGSSIHMCLASRHYPNISTENVEELSLDAHQDHESDIITYVQSQLRLKDSALKVELSSSIVARASGVFLWVGLVVKVLNKEADHGNHHRLRDKLREIPDGLNDLYDSILEKGDADERLLPAILWILFAKKPLNSYQVYQAIMLSTGQSIGHKVPPAFEVNAEVALNYILSSSRGLLECKDVSEHRRVLRLPHGRYMHAWRNEPPSIGYIDFIHESVREYFLERGLRKFDTSLGSGIRSTGHAHLARWCQIYIPRQCFDKTKEELEYTQFPLTRYVMKYALEHAEEAVREGYRDLIYAEIPFETWHFVCQCRDFTPSTMLQVLVRYNCPSLVKLELERNAHRLLGERQAHLNAQAPDTRGCAALQIATSKGNIDMAHILTSHGADVNLCCECHGSPLHTAVRRKCYPSASKKSRWETRWEIRMRTNSLNLCAWTRYVSRHTIAGMVELLLEQGAAANMSNNVQMRHGNILHHAVSTAQQTVTAMLLAHGADPNTTSKGTADSETVLDAALESRNPEIVVLLLSHGADVNRLGAKSRIALQLSVRDRDANMVSVLNDPKVPLSRYATAARLAWENGDFDILRGLHGADHRDVSESTLLTRRQA